MINRNKAFSLIELMVVIAIVAVLAAVALPAYRQYVFKSKIDSILPIVNNMLDEQLQVLNTKGYLPTGQQLGYPATTYGPNSGNPNFISPTVLKQADLTDNNSTFYLPGGTGCVQGLGATITINSGDMAYQGQYPVQLRIWIYHFGDSATGHFQKYLAYNWGVGLGQDGEILSGAWVNLASSTDPRANQYVTEWGNATCFNQ